MKYVSAILIGFLAAYATASTDSVVYGGLTALAGILAIEGISFFRLFSAHPEVTSSEDYDLDLPTPPNMGEQDQPYRGPKYFDADDH